MSEKHFFKILVVFGTRPEAIKMAPVIKEMLKRRGSFETIVCSTGQHKEILNSVLDVFEIKTDYDLSLMQPGQNLDDVTSKILIGVGGVLEKEKPDLVLVHGDTTTSMASALASFYKHIPVGHVEAGLRTHDIYSPWPEEVNRQITGRIATLHFAPTPLSEENLIKENVLNDKITVTGNTVIDALQMTVDRIEKDSLIRQEIREGLQGNDICEALLSQWSEGTRRLVLITGHRRENFGRGFENMCEGIARLADSFPQCDFLYPVHPNPNIRNTVTNLLSKDLGELPENIILTLPLGYLEFVEVLKLSAVVLTDSGGIQEEAPSLGKPVFVMRDTTERPEAVDAGTVKLVGTKSDVIFESVSKVLISGEEYIKMAGAVNPYGDGKASGRILDACIEHLNKENL